MAAGGGEVSSSIEEVVFVGCYEYIVLLPEAQVASLGLWCVRVGFFDGFPGYFVFNLLLLKGPDIFAEFSGGFFAFFVE